MYTELPYRITLRAQYQSTYTSQDAHDMTDLLAHFTAMAIEYKLDLAQGQSIFLPMTWCPDPSTSASTSAGTDRRRVNIVLSRSRTTHDPLSILRRYSQ